MHPELTNLLPEDRLRGLRREYFYRLTTVSLLLLTALLAIHGFLLIPTYNYLQKEISTRTERLGEINQTLASADEKSLDTRLATLEGETSSLGALATSTPQSQVLREVLAVPDTGMLLSGFTLSPTVGKTPETVTITGIADTRDDLRAYYLALSGASFVSTANLPVSDYAAESNISFAITLTLP